MVGAPGPSADLVPIHAPEAVEPHGHYSQGMRCGSLIFISGILGNNDASGAPAPPVEAQALQCLEQIVAIASAGGSGREGIVRVGIFISDIGAWPRVNQLYSEFFGQHRPARIVVPCGPMRLGSLVEMDAVALVGEPGGEAL